MREGVQVLFAAEDTSRATPEAIRELYSLAINEGATRICVTDTVGYCTPKGVGALMDFMCEVVEASGTTTEIDWHGHNDRGLALANALAAADHGAARIHATGLGFGERTGNTSVEQLIVNFSLSGNWDDKSELAVITQYCEAVHRYCGAPMPENMPLVGSDAFRTSSGIHASAIVKAMHDGQPALAAAVYSSVPASVLGRHQLVDVGPMSGKSNVYYWLEQKRILCSQKESEQIA